MPRRGFAGAMPADPAAVSGNGYPPPGTMAVFSSRVIFATRRCARWSAESRAFVQGRGVPPADAEACVDHARGDAAAAPGLPARQTTATTTPLTRLMALTFMAAPGRETAARHPSSRMAAGDPRPSTRQLRVSVARRDGPDITGQSRWVTRLLRGSDRIT